MTEFINLLNQTIEAAVLNNTMPDEATMDYIQDESGLIYDTEVYADIKAYLTYAYWAVSRTNISE